MNSEIHPALLRNLIEELAARLRNTSPGTCVRVDHVGPGDSESMTVALRTLLPQCDVFQLSSSPAMPHEIGTDRAVELRNRKNKTLILIVPSGIGEAASSLDNSFERLNMSALVAQAGDSLTAELRTGNLADLIREVRRNLGKYYQPESWAQWAAALSESPSPATASRELWRLGLIPDLDPDSMLLRIGQNIRTISAIARCRRPTSTIPDRLTAAGLKEGPHRSKIETFLLREGSPLSDPTRWCHKIATTHPHLAFQHWPIIDQVTSDLDTLSATPFRKPDNSVDKSCKLSEEDNQLVCRTSEVKPGVVGVRWETMPPRTTQVFRWRLDLVPPLDLRDEQAEPIISAYANGTKRNHNLKIDVTEDDLSNGHRFVIKITALDENGDAILLKSGDLAVVDTDEFDVLVDDAAISETLRKSSAGSVAEAVLQASVDGISVLPNQEDYDVDRNGGILKVRLAGRRQAQIRVSPLLIDLEHDTLKSPSAAYFYTARSIMGRRVDFADVMKVPLTLPTTMGERRKAVLARIAASPGRSLVESVEWDTGLRTSVTEYLASFRRALDAATQETLPSLLQLDSFTIHLRTPAGETTLVLLLPTHPLRLAWLMTHDQLLRTWASSVADIFPVSQRKHAVDMSLVQRITSANLPFTCLDSQRCVLVHAEEITNAFGLYIRVDDPTPELTLDLACQALGVSRDPTSLKARASQAANRIDAYLKVHSALQAFLMVAVNPGNGELIARLIRPLVAAELGDENETFEPRLMRVISYMDHAPFNNPLPAVREIQSTLRNVSGHSDSSHLMPPLGISIRPLDRAGLDEETIHIAVVQDISTGTVVLDSEDAERVPSLQELMTSTHTFRVGNGSDTTWTTTPSLRSRQDSQVDIAAAHRAHQAAISRLLGSSSGFPAISVTLQASDIARLRSLHSRADWIITVDRFLGLDLYEDSADAGLGSSYILDYAPEFVEGLAERLTVTTGHRGELLRVLEQAMTQLGLARFGSETLVLNNLTMVSGRLALRLLGSDSKAREAVSLAALMAYLQKRGELDGHIMIPVDAHPEIFGTFLRSEGEGTRRCDLLLIKITQRSFKIECIEVKARQGAALPQALADQVVDQLKDTESVLRNRFFDDDPPRIDRELQRTRLIALLHYYADRAFLNEFLNAESLEESHRLIDRIEEQGKNAEISMHGYVISLEGRLGFPSNHRGVPITVLTGEDLSNVGFTTLSEIAEHSLVVTLGSVQFNEKPNSGRPKDKSESSAIPLPPAPSHIAEANAPDSNPACGAVSSNASEPSKRSEAELNFHNEAMSKEAQDTACKPAKPSPSKFTSSAAVAFIETSSTNSDAVAPNSLANAELPSEVRVELGLDPSGRNVEWELSTKGSPHAFIVGIPGQGKSVTTRRIIRTFADQGLPSLVFDFHGDMAANPPSGATVLDVAINGLPFSPFELRNAHDDRANVNVTSLEVAEIIAYVCEMGDIQLQHVYKGLRNAYISKGWSDQKAGSSLPTIEEFANAVEAVESGAKGKNARDRLRPLTDFGLFQENPSSSFDPMASGKGLIVDVSKVPLERVQVAASAFILRKVYRDMFRWGQEGVMRLAVVLDEAHRLTRDKTLPKLMKEGRKYGISVVVASQGLSDFKKEVVGNAGLKIVFRTNFPDSKTVAGYLRGRNGVDLSQKIESLGVGQAYISSPDVPEARRVQMYQ